MYFPYLRGKQFELIALREISNLLAEAPNKVSPIIEPVKESSTFRNILSDFRTKNINFNVIINPKVGDLQGSTNKILSVLNEELYGYKNFQVGVILTGKEKHPAIIKELQSFPNIWQGLTLIHNAVCDNIDGIIERYNSVIPIKFNVVYFSKTDRRYYRNFASSTLVSLDDYFSAQNKNSDYQTQGESDFSEEHKYFRNDGFVGFSDFLTIGDSYSESGFLPYAIAIHLSYANTSNKIKVKHFVSDLNSDNSDIAGKFAEALDKLVSWCNANNINTKAVDVFRELHELGHFPGLGSIKKLSILNHIELVFKLI